MKFILLLLTALELSNAINPMCISKLPFLEVCAYGFCFFNIAQADLQVLNCERALRGMPPLKFHAEGKCSKFYLPKCKTFNF